MRWTCPYCGHLQTETSPRYDLRQQSLRVGKTRHGDPAFRVIGICCSNPDCMDIEVRFEFAVGNNYESGELWKIDKALLSRRILPESYAKPQPDYIPEPLRVDYLEACRIRDLSPKAAATLARRCLQGMIRDFCEIKKGRLVDEIDALRTEVEAGEAPSGVTTESVDAIDHVRSVGNIGAHMEKDINLIIEVDPGEAQALIELIELLFEEWYIARKTRKDRLDRVKQIAESKKPVNSTAKVEAPSQPEQSITEPVSPEEQGEGSA